MRLAVTLSAEEVDKVIAATYRQLATRVRVPGFRPGKAPRALVQRTIGVDTFYHEATDDAVQEYFPRAVTESGFEPIDRPQIELGERHVVDGEPFELAGTFSVRPEVKLPDYGAIRIPAPPVIVTDRDVDDVITVLRQDRATLEPAPGKAAEIGDVVTMNIHGRAEGREVINRESFDFELIEEQQDRSQDEDEDDERSLPPDLPGLSAQLVAAEVGDIREITISLPADYQDPDLAGHTVFLNILVKGVKRKILPALNDEFVHLLSGYSTVAELREGIRDNITQERTARAQNKVAQDVIDSLIARTSFAVPEVLIDEEQERMLETRKRWFERRGMSLERLLLADGMSEEEFRAQLRQPAEREVRRGLILDAVAKAEHIAPSRTEVERTIFRTVASADQSERERERLLHSDRVREVVAEDIARGRALARLVEIVGGLKILPDEVEPASSGEVSAALESDDAVPPVAAGAGEEPEPCPEDAAVAALDEVPAPSAEAVDGLEVAPESTSAEEAAAVEAGAS